MLSGRIVGPLQQLQRDALSLASGDLTHQTTVKTDDEVGNLAEAFNRMAASIERRPTFRCSGSAAMSLFWLFLNVAIHA
jgi:nitrogen fixation/metabolism regulation signal transduction histidine kinase